MKITAKQFALSLYESVEGKSAGEIKVVIKNFVEILSKKSRLAMADKIIKEFTRVWQAERGQVEAEITSASDLSNETVKLIQNYVKKLSGANEAIVTARVDRNILGGVIIKYGDRVLDGSLKNSLAELKEKLVK
jgi:F-type H+-transporting ATPase subunit delta